MDYDPVGEGIIAGLNVQRSLPSVQRVLLVKVDVIHTSNLEKHKNKSLLRKQHMEISVLGESNTTPAIGICLYLK